MEAINNGDDNDFVKDLTLKKVETVIAGINLMPTETDKTAQDELEVAFSTKLVFDDLFTVPSLGNVLSDTVRSGFSNAREVEKYMDMLRSAVLSMNKVDSNPSFFVLTSEISLVAVQDENIVLDNESAEENSNTAWIVAFFLTLSILLTLVLFTMLCRIRKRKKQYWLKRTAKLESNCNDIDDATIVFEEGGKDVDKHILSEKQRQPGTSSSLFQPFGKIFYDSNGEEDKHRPDIDEDCKDESDDKKQRCPSLQPRSSTSSRLLQKRYDERVQLFDMREKEKSKSQHLGTSARSSQNELSKAKDRPRKNF